jgi:pimeloyl-ACP methyl ester carboxylesterase
MRDAPAQHFAGLASESYGTDDGRPALVLVHGLTYDRRTWGPALRELQRTDPDRRVLALDLPGHGGSPRRESYSVGEVCAVLHEAVADAGLDAPVMVGHSLGGLLATVYAATYPTRGVVNVDQPLLTGPFADELRRIEPVLRSPAYGDIWNVMLASMHIEQLPADAQDLVRTATTPRQDLLLGYWNEVLVTPADELDARLSAGVEAIRSSGISYRYVSGSELDPAYRQWLESVLPDAVITVLPHSGHFPHLGHPAQFAQLLALA